MKLIIDIHEKEYQSILNSGQVPYGVVYAIMDGTPLPKGHGRLINADALIKYVEALPKEANGYSKVYDEAMIIGMIENTPTIIGRDDS